MNSSVLCVQLPVGSSIKNFQDDIAIISVAKIVGDIEEKENAGIRLVRKHSLIDLGCHLLHIRRMLS